MRQVKQSKIFIFVFLAFFLICAYVHEVEAVNIPKQIKVGIRYGQSGTPIVTIFSDNGLELGYYIGNEYKAIYTFLGNEELQVRKDSFFVRLSGHYVEYHFDEQKDTHNLNIQGPIHIQIGEDFEKREEAEAFMKSLPSLHEEPYLAFEDGWKVWAGLYTSIDKANDAISSIKNLISDQKLSIIPPHNKRVQVVNMSGKVLLMYNTENQIFHFQPILSKDSIGLVQVDGKKFRGNIIIGRYTDSDLTVINQLNLEEYLYGVVPREMSGEWPIEALKAQAVAARNYAVVNLNKHKNYGFDVCSTTHCQVYGGYDSEHPNSTAAVDQTKGKLLTYNGKVITAFYHANSGGHTEDIENVWSYPLEYIRGVEDKYSIGKPNDTWTATYTKEEIEDILDSRSMSIGSLINIAVTEYSKNGRVLKLEIIGTNGRKILEKDKIRNILGYNNIKSTWFEVRTDANVNILDDYDKPVMQTSLSDKYIISSEGVKKINILQNHYIFNGIQKKSINAIPSKYVFYGKGWGHGLGMSQWGAKTMAENGFTYEQILTHYYTGTKVE